MTWRKLRTWILAGQSNMEGCGLMAELSPEIAAPDARVRSFSSAGRWEIAEEPLHRLADSFTPVHGELLRSAGEDVIAWVSQVPRIGGAGLGKPFGLALADATGEPVGLIPSAHGGTSLDQWSPALKDWGGHSLYGSMLERVRIASESADIEIAGILWSQGETDCFLGLAATYAERFDAWVTAARADLGIPDLPVYVAQSGRAVEGSGYGIPGIDVLREAQRTISDRLPATGCVATIDLPLTDSVHVSTAGLLRLGRRLARLASGGREVQPETLERRPNTYHDMAVLRLRCTGVVGGWRATGPIPGFQLTDATGTKLGTTGIVDATIPADDPAAIEIRTLPLPVGAHLSYGLGREPICLLADESDNALPAFAPRLIPDLAG